MSLLKTSPAVQEAENIFGKSTVAVVSTSDNFLQMARDAVLGLDVEIEYARHLSELELTTERLGQLCIVLDYQSPKSFEVPQVMLKLREVMALIVVVPGQDPEAVFHAACMGALHVINRPIDTTSVAGILNKVFALNKTIADRADLLISEPLRQYTQLNERQSRILRMLMRGEPNKAIASRMDLGLRTIESERAKMMKKFGVQSLAELVRFATLAAEQLRHVRAREFMRVNSEQSCAAANVTSANAV